MAEQFRIGDELDYRPSFGTGAETDYAPSFEPAPAPASSPAAVPKPRPTFSVGEESDYRPAFGVGKETDYAPSLTEPATTPSAPGADIPIVGSLVRGAVTGGIGAIEDAGTAAEVLRRKVGSDKDSFLGQIATTLDEGMKGQGGGYARQVPSLSDIDWSPTRAGTYVLETLGSGLASTAPSLVAGLAGGAAGEAAAGPPGAAVGAWTASSIPAFVSGVGGTSRDLQSDAGIQQALKDGRITQDQLDNYAIAAGSVIGAFDVAGTGKLLNLTGFRKVERDVIKTTVLAAIKRGIREGTLAEGGTEAIQQIISEGTQAFLGGNLDLGRRLVNIADSFIGGAGVGGTVGGGGAGIETYRQRGAQQSPSKTDAGTAPPGTDTGVIPEPEGAAAPGQSTPGSTTATTPPPPAGTSPAATEPTVSTPTVTTVPSGGVDPTLAAAVVPTGPGQQPGQPPLPSSVAETLTSGPEVKAPTRTADPDLAAALMATTTPASRPSAEPSPAATPEARRIQAVAAARAQPSAIPPMSVSAPLPQGVPPGEPPPSSQRPTPSLARPLAAAAERAEPVLPPVPAVSLEPGSAPPLAPTFGVGAEIEGFVPELGPAPAGAVPASGEAVRPAALAAPASAAVLVAEPAPELTGNRQRAMADIGEEIADIYTYVAPELRDARIAAERAEAGRFIAAQPPKHPRAKMLAATRAHLRNWRAERDARETAERARPAERQREAVETAAAAERRAGEAPERAARREERAGRLRPAEEAVTPEVAAAERDPDAARTALTEEELGRVLDETIAKAVAATPAADPAEPHDESLEASLKAEAGGRGGGGGRAPGGPGGPGGGGGKIPRGRGERDRPGTPQAKSTRILRRTARSGFRQALRSAAAKTRWFARKWLSDAQLADFNEYRFAWTDDIDLAIRTEANPMRQVAEARSREAARRERLAAPFASLIDRVDRLRRAAIDVHDEFVQLLADSSALQVDPTKPRNAPENQHLGNRFTEAGYQGFVAHPVLAAQYDALVKRNPEVAGLWRDLQQAFATRRELETKTRVVGLVRPLLDRNNERARAAGEKPPPTGDAEAAALAERAIAGQLSKADKQVLSPSVQMAIQALVESGTVSGTYMPFVRQGSYVVHWTERMQLPEKAEWALELDGSLANDRFTADNSTVNAFVKQTTAEGNPNSGLIIRKIRAFKPGITRDKPIFRDEETDATWEAAEGPTRFEVHVQRSGMALYNTQAEADAAHDAYAAVADDARLELRDETSSRDLIPTDIDDVLNAAIRDLGDTLVDDATITLLDRTLKDAVASVAAGNAASARRLRRKNVSGADGNLPVVVDRYANASSGAIAKLQFLPEIDAGMRGMRASDEAQSRSDPQGQLARQQALAEWGGRVASLSDHYRVKGGAEQTVQAALTASYLTRLADVSAVLIDSTQPYLFGLSRLSGRANPARALIELGRAEKAINTAKVAGRGVADTGRSAAEAASKGLAFLKRRAGVTGAEGKRLARASHFDGIRDSVSSEKDGEDLAKMLDDLADSGLMSRDSTLEIKSIDPDSQRGFNRILEPMADLARQLRIAVDIRNQSLVAVAAYRIARRQGDTHARAVAYARDAVRQSQFDSTHATAAPAFKLRGFARAPLQFKRFAVQSIVGMARMMQAAFYSRNMTAAQRKEWRRILITANVVMVGAAGVSGHPLAMVAGLFIQALAAAMGEPPREWELELEVEAQEWLAKLFAQEFGGGKGGKEMAHRVAATVIRGLPSGLGPVDVSKRIGLGDLFVHGKPESLDTKGILEWIGVQLLGAPGETVASPLDGLKAIHDGNWEKAGELLTPKFVANVVRASRGGPETAEGEPLTKAGYTPAEAIAKGLGFQPTREADLRRQRTYQYAETERRKVRENKLRRDFEDAPTYQQKHLIYRKIQSYNRTVPEEAAITDSSLKRRQKELLKEQETYGGMTLSKKQLDIGEAGRRLNPADRPVRKKIVEYDF